MRDNLLGLVQRKQRRRPDGDAFQQCMASRIATSRELDRAGRAFLWSRTWPQLPALCCQLCFSRIRFILRCLCRGMKLCVASSRCTSTPSNSLSVLTDRFRPPTKYHFPSHHLRNFQLLPLCTLRPSPFACTFPLPNHSHRLPQVSHLTHQPLMPSNI